jgi:excisionase family DNA binding protein
VSGRIVLHLDHGLGWTKPLVVACCGACGAELARHPNHDRAIRAACRTRCPSCGTQTARRLPGTTSPATDLAVARGPRRRMPARAVPLRLHRKEVSSPLPAARPWLRTSEAAARLHVQPRTITRWAHEGRLEHRRTLGGHRRYDPELIDQLVQALTHRS